MDRLGIGRPDKCRAKRYGQCTEQLHILRLAIHNHECGPECPLDGGLTIPGLSPVLSVKNDDEFHGENKACGAQVRALDLVDSAISR